MIDDEAFPAGHVRDPGTSQRSRRKREIHGVHAASITLPVRLDDRTRGGQIERSFAQAPRATAAILIRQAAQPLRQDDQAHRRLTSPGGNPLVGARSRDLGAAQAAGSALEAHRDGADGSLGEVHVQSPAGTEPACCASATRGTPTIRGKTKRRATCASAPRAVCAPAGDTWSTARRSCSAGRVRSQPIPPTGKLLQLQVYSRGNWLTFATPRADARGRWRHPYRFTATRGVTQYRFRVRLPRESGYPYDAWRLAVSSSQGHWPLAATCRHAARVSPVERQRRRCRRVAANPKSRELREHHGHGRRIHRYRWHVVRRDHAAAEQCRASNSSSRARSGAKELKRGAVRSRGDQERRRSASGSFEPHEVRTRRRTRALKGRPARRRSALRVARSTPAESPIAGKRNGIRRCASEQATARLLARPNGLRAHRDARP